MSVQYIGPDPLYIRTIPGPASVFADDPDWYSPAVAAPDAGTWSTPNVRRGTMAPLTQMIVSFVFLDAAGDEVKGGTANIYAFYVNEPQVYGMPQGKRAVVRKTGSKAHDLNTDLVIEVTKHARMGVRLSTIVPPVGAVSLRIAVQELT